MAMQRKSIIKELSDPEYCDNGQFVFLKSTLSEVDATSVYPKSIKKTYAQIVQENEKKMKLYQEPEEDPLLKFLQVHPHLKMFNGMIVEKNVLQTLKEYDQGLLEKETEIELPPPGSLLHNN
jgi:hypothetical protein